LSFLRQKCNKNLLRMLIYSRCGVKFMPFNDSKQEKSRHKSLRLRSTHSNPSLLLFSANPSLTTLKIWGKFHSPIPPLFEFTQKIVHRSLHSFELFVPIPLLPLYSTHSEGLVTSLKGRSKYNTLFFQKVLNQNSTCTLNAIAVCMLSYVLNITF